MTRPADPLGPSLSRRLFDDVYERLRSAIVAGYLPPGARVVERDLTERMQVSRTPIREAMKQLEQEGLIVCYPHKGCFVRTPTFAEAEQVYEMRRALECLAAELAAARATEEDLDAMAAAIEESERSLQSGKPQEMPVTNNQFHRLLAAAARNRFLEESLHRIWAYVDLLRYHYWSTTSRAVDSHAEHQQLLAALRSRNAVEARRLTEQHVLAAWNLILPSFRADSNPPKEA